MKVGYIADVHVGNHKQFGGKTSNTMNERCLETLSVLRAACVRANAESCDALVVLGDLFDVDDPTPQVVTATWHALSAFAGTVYVLLGNHDQTSTERHDNAIALFGMSSKIVPIDRPTLVKQGRTLLALMPFNPEPPATWLGPALKELLGARPADDILDDEVHLCVHLGIADKNTPEWLEGAHDSIHKGALSQHMADHSIRYAFAGNWHDRKTAVKGGRTITQCGALVPTGFDNPGGSGLYGALVTACETEGLSIHEIDGPRFFKYVWPITEAPEGSYIHIVAEPEDLTAANRFVKDATASNAIRGGKVTVNADAARTQARAAAKATSRADTLRDAVNAYVAKTPIPAGADKHFLARLIHSYLTN